MSYLSKLTDTLNFWCGGSGTQGSVVVPEVDPPPPPPPDDVEPETGTGLRHAVTSPLKWKPVNKTTKNHY